MIWYIFSHTFWLCRNSVENKTWYWYSIWNHVNTISIWIFILILFTKKKAKNVLNTVFRDSVDIFGHIKLSYTELVPTWFSLCFVKNSSLKHSIFVGVKMKLGSILLMKHHDENFKHKYVGFYILDFDLMILSSDKVKYYFLIKLIVLNC